MENFADEVCLDSDDLLILREMANGIGTSHSDDQKNKMSVFAGRLRQRLSQSEEKLASMGKIYIVTGWCFGIILSIFFV